MSKIVYYTYDDLEKLKSELNQLMSVERVGISRQIAEARDKGDLSENAEYDAAKEAQGLLEMRIVELEKRIASARVLDTSKLDVGKVSIYTTVEIRNLKTKSTLNYTLVPDSESNIKEKKISVSSPIGKGLLGKKIKDIAHIDVPSGVMEFEILSINISN